MLCRGGPHLPGSYPTVYGCCTRPWPPWDPRLWQPGLASSSARGFPGVGGSAGGSGTTSASRVLCPPVPTLAHQLWGHAGLWLGPCLASGSQGAGVIQR